MPPIPSRLGKQIPEPNIVMVPIEELFFDPKNPPRRLQGPKMDQLRGSLRRNGFFTIITVCKSKIDGKVGWLIVDGHRRVTALRLEDYKGTVACKVVSEEEAKRIYADIQCGMAQDAVDRLFLFFNDPEKLTEKDLKEIEAAHVVLEYDLLKELADKGLSLQYYKTARRFANYCSHRADKDWIRQGVRWQIKFGSQSMVRALACKAPVQVLANSVFGMKKMNETYTETQE